MWPRPRGCPNQLDQIGGSLRARLARTESLSQDIMELATQGHIFTAHKRLAEAPNDSRQSSSHGYVSPVG